MPSFAGSAGTLPVFWAAFRAEVLIRISVYSLETLLSGGLLIGYPVHLRLVPSCEVEWTGGRKTETSLDYCTLSHLAPPARQLEGSSVTLICRSKPPVSIC